MRSLSRRVKVSRLFKGMILFGLGLLVAVRLAACGSANIAPGNAPLAAVSALNSPKMPDWIEQISPTEQAETTAQIRIRFKEPLIPVESLESSDQQAILKKFELLPPLPGQFRFLTPRMVGFQADRAIPKATRVQVTLKSGLADLKNHRLDQDFAWTFNTEPIALTDLPGTPPNAPPGEASEPLELKPHLRLTSNTELDLASLKEHLKLVPMNGKTSEKTSVALNIALEKQDETTPAEQFDPADRRWLYNLEPQQDLTKATRYTLEVTPGLQPATGNLPSENPFVSQVETYAPFAFQKLGNFGQPDAGGAVGRFAQGMAQLQFNNPVDAESVLTQIAIDPKPKKDLPLVQTYFGERVVNLNPWALEPNTRYTITIGGDLKDKFGQTLGKPITLPYTTGDVTAEIWAPSGLHIFPTGKNLQLNVSTVNLSSYKSAFAVVQPTDLVYADTAYPRENGTDLLPEVASWKSSKINFQKNQSIEIPVPLQKELGGPTGLLAYGVQARTNQYPDGNQQKWREPTHYGLVQLTNLGVFSQWFPESGLVRVHHLSDGATVPNATVQVYQSKLDAKSRSTPTPCATGKTDRTGTWLLDRAAMQPCLAGFENTPELLTIAQEGKDWAFTRTLEYSGTYEYGLDGGWQTAGKPESRGTVFSDRQLYQPGETAWFTGAAYYLQNGKLQQDKKAKYTLTLTDPSGQKTNLGSPTTNDFGMFSLKWDVPKTQAIGVHTLQAKSETGVEITGELRVAEFKPPNFKVELGLEGGQATGDRAKDLGGAVAIVQADQTIAPKVQSRYLFGAPVEGGKVNYYVTRQKADFKPQGWEQFSFGRQWFWPEEAPSLETDVMQSSQSLNKDGQSSETVKVANDLPYPMTYRVDAQVSDVSNLSVADSKTFLAVPSDRTIGLQSDFVAEAGKPFSVNVIVADVAGKPLVGQQVRLELQQMNYSRVTRLVEGSRTQQNQVEYKTVATAEARSDVQPQSVNLAAPSSGSYRIRAQFADSRNDVTATDTQIWVTGDSAAAWGDRYRNNRLEIKLDKATYRPGETATALIQSPYPEGELYFAVVRHNALYKTVTTVKGGAPKIQFQVTPEMVPNAAIEAVLVRQGQPLEQVEPGSLDNLTRIGFAPFNTRLDDQYLTVETVVTPSLMPGGQQAVQLNLKNAQNQPTKGNLAVMVVNEAVLQLSGYRPPDLVKTVYADQPISTRLSDNRPDVVLQPQSSPIDKGWGYGGGFSAGAASTRTRTDFRPIAYYNGSVQTDANGRAMLTFNLPDDLTTWRVMSVATDGNLHFGNGDATFITTQPLIANPLLPQFARPGDRFQAGVSVTNTSGRSGSLSVSSTVSEPLKLEASPTAQAQIAADGTTAYRFPVTVQTAGESKLRFNTQLQDLSDGFEVPLSIRSLDVTEQVVETGTTTNQAKIPLNVQSNVASDVGGLQLSLSSTLIPTIAAPTQQLLNETDLPFLEPAASQLTIAAHLQTLSKTYGQALASFQPLEQAQQALERLQPLQKPDGGFAAYPNAEKSDPFVTPFAAQAIAQLEPAFPAAQLNAQTLLPDLKRYLNKLLADPGQYDFCKEQACKNQVRLETLIALAELGDTRSDFVADLYEQRAQFDPVSQLKLARYLSQLPDWQPAARELSTKLQATIAQTGRSATVNLPQGWRWLNSPTTAQAQAFRLAIAQKADPATLDRLLQGLLNQRRQGIWPSTYDTAQALTALVEYSRLQPTPPNFEATAELAGKTLGTAKFVGYRNPSATFDVAMKDLPRDRHDLVLQKSGQGTLHYLAAYRYRVQGNQPGRLNGLRITRTIRPANAEKVLAKTGLVAPDPLSLGVGQVYDVGLEIITDHPVDRVIITDPLPAGLEAVDNSFQTTTPYFQARGDRWQLDYQTLHRDRMVAAADSLSPGVYTLHYLVRSVTPGTFLYPGAEAHLQYAPEEFGRTASTTLTVTE